MIEEHVEIGVASLRMIIDEKKTVEAFEVRLVNSKKRRLNTWRNKELTCDSDILKELKAKQYRPVYYLMGEESYYIDLIADYIAEHVLNETEKSLT